jgi:ankyrin repeat protein
VSRHHLRLAVEEGSVEIVRYLCGSSRRHIFQANTHAALVALCAAGQPNRRRNNTEILEYLIGQGVPVDGVLQFSTDPIRIGRCGGLRVWETVQEHFSDNWTTRANPLFSLQPLHYLACRRLTEETMVTFLRLGADVNALTVRGYTPLDMACVGHKIETVRMLHRQGGVATVHGLFEAIEYCNLDIVKYLCEEMDFNTAGVRNESGYTPLHCAAKTRVVALMEYFLNRNPEDINAPTTDSSRSTPLHHAILRGNLKVARLLVERGANPNLQESKQNTAAHFLIYSPCSDLMATLIDAGANLCAINVYGMTPLGYALSTDESIKECPLDLIFLLLSRGGLANGLSGALGIRRDHENE